MLGKLLQIKQLKRPFFIKTPLLFIPNRGKIIFLQLARYRKFKEQQYRQQFEKPFDFLTFNKMLTLSQRNGRYVIVFDPRYVSNSDKKKTPGVGWYWYGCSNSPKWGLEIRGIAAIDIDNHTVFHLEAIIILNADDHSRFQIGFLYRDGKQHTGLPGSQARSEHKLNFQFNASQTSINIVKVIFLLNSPKEKRGAFSMSNFKKMNHNILLINRFCDVFGTCPYSIETKNYVKELILCGTKAA